MVPWKSCILMMILLVAQAGTAAAHPPAAVQLSSGGQSGEVILAVTHSVDDPATHFIRQVEIRKNGVTVVREEYTRQPSEATFSYPYPLVAAAGDEIVAIATCNIGGSGTARFMVPGQAEPVPPEEDALPGWVVHAVIVVAGMAGILIAALLPAYGKGISGWYRLHVLAAVGGSVLAVIAIVMVFWAPYLSASPSVFSVHVILGVLLLLSLLAALVLGATRELAGPRKVAFRRLHIWLGRVFIVLVVINLLIGLLAVGVL